jgi:CheY-like chemotaxis protein
MRTILLVDDSPVARRVVARRLVAEGFRVREEATAAAARGVELASLACAVIDLDLPDGDGTELAAALLGARPSLPLAFFTAGASAALVERARAHGPVFTKPQLEPLVAWIKRAVQPPPTK